MKEFIKINKHSRVNRKGAIVPEEDKKQLARLLPANRDSFIILL